MSEEKETAVVRCGTSAGDIAMTFHRKWSPHGYDRAVELFEKGFYDNTHFFRVVPNFLVQFGITYSSSEELKRLGHHPIPDDPQLSPPIPFEKGTISYAGGGDNSRTSQLFIAHGPGFGKSPWETPVGEVTEGMENVNNFYSYGDMPPWGDGPVQGKIYAGRSYIEDNFPLTDHFLKCSVERKNRKEPEELPVKLRRTIKDHTVEQEPKSEKTEFASAPTSSLNQKMTGNTQFIALLFVIGIVAMALFRMGRKEKGSKSK